jgi:hypothetical protein
MQPLGASVAQLLLTPSPYCWQIQLRQTYQLLLRQEESLRLLLYCLLLVRHVRHYPSCMTQRKTASAACNSQVLQNSAMGTDDKAQAK